MFEAGIVFPYIFKISLTIVYTIVTWYGMPLLTSYMQKIHIALLVQGDQITPRPARPR